MASKKKTTSDKDTNAVIVAFALRDFVAGEGKDAFTLSEGQRIELSADQFAEGEKEGIVAKGVFVKMKTAVEGGRYSLKPHDTTWLPPHVYEAWKAAGYCEPTQDDPEVGAVLKARDEATRAAASERDRALLRCSDLEEQLQEAGLLLQAVRVQSEKLRGLIEPAPDSGDVLDDEATALLGEVVVLIGMFPEHIETNDEGSTEPELKLD